MYYSALKRTGLYAALAAMMFISARGGTPDWVKKRPIIQGVYVGIGMTQKNHPASEYTEAAKNIALNDIASQINVTISSDVLRKVFETNDKLGDEFQSNVRASAKAEIEGAQLVDTYESDDEYWVYYRLSKAEYEARKAEKMQNAVSVAFDFYSKGRKYEKQGDIAHALGQYAQAFGPVERYLGEPLAVEIDGRQALLVNELYNAMQSGLSRIELKTSDGKRDVKVGRPVKPSLELTAMFGDVNKTPAANLPFKFSFLRGGGDMVASALTDNAGSVRCDVQKITAPDRIQIISAVMDLQGLLSGASLSPVVMGIINSFPVPSTKFVLNATGVDVYIESSESMFGQKLAQNRIEPVLKSALGDQGFAFVGDMAKAALVINIKADARKGAETHGLAFSFVSVTVSVLDMETGKEIFKNAMEDVKEGSDSFEKAAYRGFNSAAQKTIEEMMPKLVERVQK